GYGPPGTFTLPGPAASLRLLSQGSEMDASYAVVDDPYPVTVEALDNIGSVAGTYTGTIQFKALAAGGASYPATPPLDGGTYRFQTTDQGRQSFSPGFVFHDSGTAVARVEDVADSNLWDQVMVTVISRTDLRIVRDANPSAAIGVPYLYNAAGRV